VKKMTRAQIMLVKNEKIGSDDIFNKIIDQGYEISAVASGIKEALKKAEKIDFDLLIIDIRLSDKNEIMKSLKLIGSIFIPVIYLISPENKKTDINCSREDNKAYIIKFDLDYFNKTHQDELHNAIESVLYKHKMEYNILMNKKRMEIILNNVSEAIIFTDSERKVQIVNTPAEDILGLSKENIHGIDLMEVLNPISGQLGLLGLDDISMTRPLDFSKEIIADKSGNKILIEGTLNPIKDVNGRIEGWVMIFKGL
jgi:PAS domain S-box-containing protein